MQASGSSGSDRISNPSPLHIANIVGVFAQHLAFDYLEAFGTGVLDDHLHEQVAETASHRFPESSGIPATETIRV
jgi:hypothetical protein